MSRLVSSPLQSYCTTTCQSALCNETNSPCQNDVIIPELEITKLLSRHLTSSCSDQETAAIALCRMLPTQEILFVKDSDMKAMISPISVGKIQSLLFHRHRNREFTGGTCSPRFCNKQRRIMYFICSYIFIFDLFREGCPSTEVVFQGALSSALFIFNRIPCQNFSHTLMA